MDINDFAVTNIKTEIKNNKRVEENLRLLLPSFSCPVNPDVERFIHEQAIDFSKRSQSVTYLVFLDGELLAYFTLAIKPISVNAAPFSNTMRRKIERVSEVNEQTGEYILAAYLIAQLGKNFADGRNKRISGEVLLRLALGKITQLQDMAGGTASATRSLWCSLRQTTCHNYWSSTHGVGSNNLLCAKATHQISTSWCNCSRCSSLPTSRGGTLWCVDGRR